MGGVRAGVSKSQTHKIVTFPPRFGKWAAPAFSGLNIVVLFLARTWLYDCITVLYEQMLNKAQKIVLTIKIEPE